MDYGINENEYREILEKQENKCAICGKNQKLLTKRLSIDHCHHSMKVRGLLCSKCNVAIGLLNDDISILENAIIYLASYQ